MTEIQRSTTMAKMLFKSKQIRKSSLDWLTHCLDFSISIWYQYVWKYILIQRNLEMALKYLNRWWCYIPVCVMRVFLTCAHLSRSWIDHVSKRDQPLTYFEVRICTWWLEQYLPSRWIWLLWRTQYKVYYLRWVIHYSNTM